MSSTSKTTISADHADGTDKKWLTDSLCASVRINSDLLSHRATEITENTSTLQNTERLELSHAGTAIQNNPRLLDEPRATPLQRLVRRAAHIYGKIKARLSPVTKRKWRHPPTYPPASILAAKFP